jgi:uncharacterized protein YndB with AHSA1/START domain
MADILQNFIVEAAPQEVFQALATPAGLDAWWTLRCAGEPIEGAEYQLWFGPEHDWRARVTRCASPSAFELELVRADADWTGTRVGFELTASNSSTEVRFHHTGWPSANPHYRTSCFCWAMYLRLLRRYLELGERVPYAQRLRA